MTTRWRKGVRLAARALGPRAADDEGAGAGEGGFGSGDAGADITDAFALVGVVEVGGLDELEAELLEDGGQAFDLQLVERPAEDVPVLGAFGVGGLAGGLLLFEPELQAGDDGEAGFGDGFEELAAAFDGVQLLGEAMGLRPDVAVDAGYGHAFGVGERFAVRGREGEVGLAQGLAEAGQDCVGERSCFVSPVLSVRRRTNWRDSQDWLRSFLRWRHHSRKLLGAKGAKSR